MRMEITHGLDHCIQDARFSVVVFDVSQNMYPLIFSALSVSMGNHDAFGL